MMKRVIAIIMTIILCITLIACSNQTPAHQNFEGSGKVTSEKVDVTSDNNKTKESDDITTVRSEKATVDSSSSPVKESTKGTETTEKKTVIEEVEPPKIIENSTEIRVEDTKTTEKKEEPKTESSYSEPTTTVKETEPVRIKTPSVTEVEEKLIEYINQYRVEQGQTSAVVLNGLNSVARYRARQLVNSYEHVHPRTTCGELKYGKYVDLSEYGLPETDNYYEGFDKEALCKGDWSGTAEQIAQTIATGFKNSSVHWGYVGQSKYQYMGVGIYYDETTEIWYGCICMSKENYGG